MRISDWSSDVCSSDLFRRRLSLRLYQGRDRRTRDPVARYAAAGYFRQLDQPCRLGQPRRASRRPAVRLAGIRRLRTRGREPARPSVRAEEHTSELQSLMRISNAVFCLKIKTLYNTITTQQHN